MPNAIQIIEEGDPFALIFLIVLCHYIGNAMTVQKGHLRVLGTRIAVAAFIAYLIYGWVTYGVSKSSVLVSIVWRAGLLFGLVRGFSCIGLTAADFCLDHLLRQVRRVQQKFASFRYRLGEPKRRRLQELAEQQARVAYERQAPERDRQLLAEQQQKMKKLRLKALRTQKTYEAELLYNKLLKDDQPVFQREAFDKMLEYVFAPQDETAINGRLTMLFDSMGACEVDEEPEQVPHSMDEIADQFNSRRKSVETCTSYSEKQKQLLLRRLNLEEGHAVQQFINR